MSTESVGPFLKRERETQGLSLDHLASVTRIQQKYLQAIEEEQFTALPEQVFTKGFVRTYARSLGLDEHDALRRFSQAWNGCFGGGPQEDERIQLKGQDHKRDKPNRTKVVIVLIVAVLGLVLFLSRQQQPHAPSVPAQEEPPSVSSPLPVEEEPGLPQPEPIAELPVEPKVEPKPPPVPVISDPPAVELPQVQDPPKPIKRPTPPPAVVAGPLIMELEATQLTWVVVKSDEGEPKEALLQPKQRTRWKAKKKFTLTLGNAGGVRVWLNGESRGPFGKAGQIVRNVVIRN